MSQQQPGFGPPQQPALGAPHQQPTQWGAPPPPKKNRVGKILGFGCLGVVGLFVILAAIGAAVGGGDSTDTSNKDKAVNASSDKPSAQAEETTADKPASKEPPSEDKTQAEEFKECVAKSGTATEKKAISHVTKVTGVDSRNDILDAAEVFTDYSGGFLGPHTSDGKLIASAFASCYESDNGLVTVYDKDGEILSNGNY